MAGETLFWDIETDEIADFKGATIQKALITTFCGVFTPSNEEVKLVLPRHHTADEKNAFLAGIAAALDKAKRTVVFNGFAFDLIALSGSFAKDTVKRWCSKTTDPMVAVMHANDGYPKALNNIAAANGLEGKTMKGAEAPAAWRNGEHERLLEYCMKDVQILRSLFEMGEVTLPAKHKKFEKRIKFATDDTGGSLGRRRRP